MVVQGRDPAPESAFDRHQDDAYFGPATLSVRGEAVEVEVAMRGRFESIDGRYRWYGRVWPSERLAQLVGEGTDKVVCRVRTPLGEAEGTVGDVDFWGRYRLYGRSRPPFHIPSSVEELERSK